jgi:hypothetical protein
VGSFAYDTNKKDSHPERGSGGLPPRPSRRAGSFETLASFACLSFDSPAEAGSLILRRAHGVYPALAGFACSSFDSWLKSATRSGWLIAVEVMKGEYDSTQDLCEQAIKRKGPVCKNRQWDKKISWQIPFFLTYSQRINCLGDIFREAHLTKTIPYFGTVLRLIVEPWDYFFSYTLASTQTGVLSPKRELAFQYCHATVSDWLVTWCKCPITRNQ